MQPIQLSSCLTVRKNKKGRSLYATMSIDKGEIIERSPVLVLPNDETRGKVIVNYRWYWGRRHSAIVLGLGSLFNHNDDPNVEWYPKFDAQVMVFKAKKDIAPWEELLVNYGPNYCFKPLPAEKIR